MMKCRFLLLLATLMGATVPSMVRAATGDSQVARWKDNKTACFLLMFDDSMPSAFQVAIPELVKRNMIGTFYVNPGKSEWTSNAQQWETTIPQKGMVYGDHTWDHGNTTTLIGMDDEIRKCQEKIKGIHYPGDGAPRLISYGQPGVATWYSYGSELTAILEKYNLISRPPFDAAHGSVYGITSVAPILALADSAISNRSMQYLITHGLERRPSEGDTDYGYQDFWAFNKDVYRAALDGLKIRQDRGDLWITDHISYHKYETERNGATLQVTTATDSLITLTLSATCNALYDHPLTVMTQVPVSWRAAVVVQDTRQVNVPVVGGSIQYDALPNAGSINITESPLPVVTVKATTPEAYETAAVPGAFTISTSGTEPLVVNYTITGTGGNGARYAIAASPLVLGVPSATVNVVPLPNNVYEGEQSVVMTITAGSDYVVGTVSAATVMIHDRTDVPPADWYLHANQTSSQHWNTQATWWSQPVGGTALPAFSRGTVADRFHANGFEVRTKNAYYPPEQGFYGNNIVLDGAAAKLNLALTSYYGSAGMPSNTVPSLTTYGGNIIPYSSSLTQVLTVGAFNNLGATRISNGGNAANPSCGLNLKVSKLTGTGDLILTNATGTSGSAGSLLCNITNATNYRGKINLAAGTLSFPTSLTSSGPLAVAAGSAVINNKTVRVARLTVGNTIIPAGTYTSAELNDKGAVFSGTGTVTTSLLPDGWSDIDVGSPALSGSAIYASALWTITGGGSQIGGTSDKFNFASALTTTSTPSILARVTSVQNTHSGAQAGIMLRDSTDGNAPCAALTVSPAGVITFRLRSIGGGTASSIQAGTTVVPPVWLRLDYAAGMCTGSYSTDNITWNQVGGAAPGFSNTPQAGLAVCAGTDIVKNVSTFSDVAVENLPPVLTAYTVSAGSLPAGTGSVSGSGIFQSGTSVTVIATPASGYGFAAWSENGTSTVLSPAYTFTVSGSRALTANFRPANLATFKSSFFTTEELNHETVSGNAADPDADGYSNLMEYALAMNPKLVNPPFPHARLADGGLSLTYKRSKTASDLAYVVEVSDNLQTWKSGPADIAAPVIQNDDGYTQTVLARDLASPSGTGSRFIRLQVISP